VNRALLPLLSLGLLLAGCKNKETQAVGNWTTPDGTTLNLAADKKWAGQSGPIAFTGTWKMDGDDVVVTALTMGGKPIAEVKANLQRANNLIRRPEGKKLYDSLDKPDYYTLAADGKTMTTNKAKAFDPTASFVFTKQGG
jgi:hypothetical protein